MAEDNILSKRARNYYFMEFTKDEKYKAREILLKISSDKIQQHITYGFAYIAALYSVNSFLPDNHILKNTELFIFFSLWFFVWLFGRFLYWTVFHGFVMTLSPKKIVPPPRRDRNCIWALNVAIGDCIQGVKEFKEEKRNCKCVFCSYFRELKFSLLHSLLISIILFIIYYLINYSYYLIFN